MTRATPLLHVHGPAARNLGRLSAIISRVGSRGWDAPGLWSGQRGLGWCRDLSLVRRVSEHGEKNREGNDQQPCHSDQYLGEEDAHAGYAMSNSSVCI
jgi:hypothetical protein